ncbi:glycosyl hydrolase family 28 protein [Bacillus sp. 3255]|uniref:glycosyl hydrolase family 28 protein n=1 Tax=Bacillus sp. 3255 TaxID=2817904 RepID=UPI0028637E61|nr:glycosyl hydrolase family 28 protein [Bacillus sp. 3255]MDR6882545.1 hypothetical protein [Bacillus sp. 3255]
MNKTVIYPAPAGAPANDDFSVWVRVAGGTWEELFVYRVKVDMHEVRAASMVYFDMEGTVEVKVTGNRCGISLVAIRPLSAGIVYEQNGNSLTFPLDRPRKLSIEVDGDRFHNLHVFANPLESDVPDMQEEGVLVVGPGIHRNEQLLEMTDVHTGCVRAPKVIYFAPGMHWLEETILLIPSHTTVYLAGGAVLAGSLVCRHAENVTIRGRGIIYLEAFHRFSAFRAIRLQFSRSIHIEGVITVDSPHYSIYIGQSAYITIQNFKSFSTRGWSDGIDMMASSHIDIDDIFMRNSDDCIAIYGSRWQYRGGSSDITVRNSVLWADVAHPINLGSHGNHQGNGDQVSGIRFENIDILEHHEPQPDYWGAIAINAGDNNTVRDVVFDNIRVEDFQQGQLFDLRVVWNAKYNPVPGKGISNITFKDITYCGRHENPSRIHGYNAERGVSGIRFINVQVNGEYLQEASRNFIDINEFTENITFEVM